MSQVGKVVARQRRDESGASAVEYGLLLAGIAALIFITVYAFGGVVQDTFDQSCDTIVAEAVPSNPNCDAG